ncbi:AT-rich interaction domain 6 [Lampris incognitus]|uniref:AT-rich interaction domain 6 n=1 Tax=Lampris incognitus TaxID=2546036 RepID=UPI0024B509E1|nr:AT-rich interaction domain 6 [Lampris incognitus]
MAQGEVQEERAKEESEDTTEETFLKDLYVFMKKRETPIERIPNLGFKKIDLFVMYKTVKGLGGYHQVTAQQLWKQVYNTLGGNPHSTSAATCTRRHYEKLLLPYECGAKGDELLSAIPPHQLKHFTYTDLCKADDGQQPTKRRALLHHNTRGLLSDSRVGVIPLTVPHCPQYYYPDCQVLSTYGPISSLERTPHTPPVLQSQHPYCLSPQISDERVKQPLEHLRYLAEQYKSLSGLTEPLNLSLKASRPETNDPPTSSFTSPTPSKNPKFLNKPSPLYPAEGTVKNQGQKTQGDERHVGMYFSVTPYSNPVKPGEDNPINIKSTPSTSSRSSTSVSASTLRTDTTSPTQMVCSKESTSKKAHIPRILKFTQEDREGSSKLSQSKFSHEMLRLQGENGGKMDIQIPVALLHDWIRLCGPSATVYEANQPEKSDTRENNWSNSDIFPTKRSVHHRDHNCSTATQDHCRKQRPETSQTPTNPRNGDCYNMDPYDFSVNRKEFHKSGNSKPSYAWDIYDRDNPALPIQLETESAPLAIEQGFLSSRSPAIKNDRRQGEEESPGQGPSAVLMVNSSDSLLCLTNEQFVKLKRIISST